MVQPQNRGRLAFALQECFVRLDRSEVEIHKLGGYRKRVYFCHVCAQPFYSVTELTAHFRGHPGKKPFQCKYCKVGFVKPDARYRHVIENHERNIPKPHKCLVCDKGFALLRSLSVHANIHQSQKYLKVCPICQVQTLELSRHIQAHTREKLHKCKYCSATFQRVGQRRLHELAVHEKTKHKCSYCEKELTSRSGQLVHERLHAEKKYQCEFCSKAFNSRNELTRHFRTHTGEKPYKCEHCVAVFRSSINARAHVKRMHEGARELVKCRSCDKVFKDSDGRRLHENHKHKGIGFRCKYCSRLCQTRTARTSHEESHTGEKTFMCGYCPKTFRTMFGLALHTSTHTGEKPYSCNECEKSFSNPTMLSRHRRVHAQPSS